MEPVPKTKSKTPTQSDPDALICAAGLLFDAPTILAQIADGVAEAKDNFEKRLAISSVLDEANQNARALIQSAYQAAPFDTAPTTRAYSYLTDQLVNTALAQVIEHLHPLPNPTSAEKIALLAVGGYGRSEMAPFSDVDLLFLSPYKMTPWAESVVESTLYVLWDLKLKIGHATRTVDECLRLAKSDLTIRTALLEARYLSGDEALAESFGTKLWKNLFKSTGPEFVTLKLEERENRHHKQGATRFLLEPNVKEGKGGLRDLQTLFWITKYLSGAKLPSEMIYQGYFTTQEYENFARAENFLWTVRCHLHLCVGRAAEQLTFDNQVAIAEALGYESHEGLLAVEAFMQDYFRHATHVGDLTRIFLTALEAQHVKQQPSFGARILRVIPWNRDDSVAKGYRTQHGRLAIADEAAFLAKPLNFLRIFEEALASDILIHPEAMRLIVANLHLIDDDLRQNPEAQKIFLSTLLDFGNPERALRRMNELGVLGAFIPEFQRIVALMQFNMYHHFTVDEHTIQCISNLARIEKGELKESLPVASGILEDGVDRKVLYVAMLLHDIGKGLPEDHSIAGARLSREIAPQLGLTDAETDTVVWLVEHHLLLSDVAQKRDLSDPRTVREFAKLVKSTSRLKLLTVLTVCDIRGVGPGTWNNWKAQLIRDLYRSTRMALQEGVDKFGKVHNAKDEAQDALRAALPNMSDTDIQGEFDRHYPAYWQGLDTETHKVFAKLMVKASTTEIASDIKPDPDRDATRACFVLQDHPGIFSRLAGALALVGANVVDARTYTTTDGYAASVFWVQDADGAPYEKSRLTRLRTMINKTLAGEVLARDAFKSRDKIKKRERDFNVPTVITFDNTGSDIYTIIEVDTRDRPGLLYDLTKTLAANNIYTASAVIATYGEQAVDVFYVKDMFGLKLHSQAKQTKIKDALTAAVERGAEVAMS